MQTDRREKVLLVQPMHLRLYGSHNNRAPLELAYLRHHLVPEYPDTEILNLDKTDADVYIPWKNLYENSHMASNFFGGASPLLDESVERIMSRMPQVVVLSAGDSLTPWADLGNPYTAALLSTRLQAYGVFTIGVGPFFSKTGSKFSSSFDAILLSPASPSIVGVVANRTTGIQAGDPPSKSAVPDFGHLNAQDLATVVMTSIGCPLSCTFCLGADSGSINIEPEHVAMDLGKRVGDYVEIGDSIFPITDRRLDEIGPVLRASGKRLACEISVNRCTRERLAHMKDLGVIHVKIGIETSSDGQLVEMKKHQNIARTERAVHAAREAGMAITGYILLGGTTNAETIAWETLEFCRRLELDDLVVNVMAHFDLQSRDFSTDAHWSRQLAEHWGVAEVMPEFFKLQASSKTGLGHILAAREEESRR